VQRVIFGFDEFELDADRLELRRSGRAIKADPLVLRLLAVLVGSAGQLVTKQELVTRVWNDRAVAENVITVAMVRLRKTLGHRRNEREFVSNVHGRGYRFVRPVTTRDAEPAPPLAPAVASAAAPPFVGRDRVRGRLRAALHELRAGRGGACVLTGEAGIGKTRMVEMLEREATLAGVLVAWGHCREAGDTPPLWPFAQLARELLARLPDAAIATRLGGAARELARLLPELACAAEAARETDAASHDPDGMARHRIFDAVTRLFTLATEQLPCLLVLDDLHRADPASLELLRYWIDELPRSRVLLVGTARRLEHGAGPAAAAHLPYVLGHRNCTRIALDPLSEAEVAAYVAAVVDDPGGALGHAVFAKSEGNPFYMTELARQLRDGEAGDPGFRVSENRPLSPGALAVPAAALDLVRQRVARLDRDARDVLSYAAVIGRSFELPVLQDVARRDASALMAALDDALASELLVAAADSRTAFAFGHELLRAVLYDDLPPVERRSRHLRVALALEQRREAGDDVLAADLAYHFHAALPDGDHRKTVRHCGLAANDAARVYANADVVRYLRHALEALALIHRPSPRLRMGLLLRQLLFVRTYSHPEFERAIREYIRVAREQAAGPALLHAALLLDPHPGFVPMTGSREALESALQLLAPDETGPRAAALARLATTAPLTYDGARAAEQVERALELARGVGSTLGLYTARLSQLYLTGAELDDRGSREALAELDRLCAEHPNTLTVPPVLLELHRSVCALQRGDVAGMTAALERGAARCRQLDSRELTWHVERFRALRRIDRGDVQGGTAALRALHERARDEEIWGTALFCQYDRNVIFGQPAGEPPAALAPGASDPPSVWGIKVRALAAAGLQDVARAALHAVAPEALARLPRDRDHLGTLGALTRAALQLGSLPYVQALYAQLEPYSDRFAVQAGSLCEGSVAQLRGMLALALGRDVEAIAQLEASIEHSERAGFTLCALSARLDLARGLARASSASDRQRAAELQVRARTELEQLGPAALNGMGFMA
jgi:eukaryotic-like serine/threonine-protein kinase